MKRIRSFFLIGLVALVLAPLAQAAGASAIRAILVTASNGKGPADPRLGPYEEALQRNVPESSFRFVAEKSAPLPARGVATLALAGPDRLEVEREGGSSLKVRWLHGNRQVLAATITLVPGTPLVYLHRPSEGDPKLVILIAN